MAQGSFQQPSEVPDMEKGPILKVRLPEKNNLFKCEMYILMQASLLEVIIWQRKGSLYQPEKKLATFLTSNLN